MYSTYLSHHGILGMKWGKKQGPPYPLSPSDHSSAEKSAGYQKSIDGGQKKAPHADHLSAHNKGEYKKDVSEMSDQELNKRLNRIRMEEQYSQISSSTKKKGKGKAMKALKTINDNLGTVVKTYATVMAVKKIIDKTMESNKKLPKYSGY